MQIGEDGFSAQNNRLKGDYDIQDDSAHNTDVVFFRSMLEHSTPAIASAAKAHTSTLLAEASAQLKVKEVRLARLLKTSSKGMEMGNFNEYPRELSNVALTSQLLVKSLGKATQCIDKICNLQ